jgi:hypothetical protein
VTKHAHVKEQTICETTFFVESVVDTTRSAYFAIDCPKCLRQALAASEARTHVLRDLLSKAEILLSTQRCRVYDTACLNPAYCDARDACCAGDPDCKPEPVP